MLKAFILSYYFCVQQNVCSTLREAVGYNQLHLKFVLYACILSPKIEKDVSYALHIVILNS